MGVDSVVLVSSVHFLFVCGKFYMCSKAIYVYYPREESYFTFGKKENVKINIIFIL